MFVPVFHTSPWMLPLALIVLAICRNPSKGSKNIKRQVRSDSQESSLSPVFGAEFDVVTCHEHVVVRRGETDDGKMYVILKCYTLGTRERIEARYIEELKRKVKVKCIKNILEILRRPINENYRKILEEKIEGYL